MRLRARSSRLLELSPVCRGAARESETEQDGLPRLFWRERAWLSVQAEVDTGHAGTTSAATVTSTLGDPVQLVRDVARTLCEKGEIYELHRGRSATREAVTAYGGWVVPTSEV